MIKGFRIGGGGSSAIAGIDLRIYDTTTGHILASKACRGVAESSGADIGYYGGDFGFDMGGSSSTPMDTAVRAAIDQAVQFITFELNDVPWEGRVVMMKKGLVYINAGSAGGIQVGDRFLVLRVEEMIVDPETGLELGAETARIGEIEVLSVEDKFSKATPLSGTDFQKNDIVRLESK